MTDFLANLVGRSLGALPVVQPRIPSIYEPYRRGGGLLGAHPGVPAREALSAPPPQGGLRRDTDAAPSDPQTREPGVRIVTPLASTRSVLTPETGPETAVSVPEANDLAPEPRGQASEPRTLESGHTLSASVGQTAEHKLSDEASSRSMEAARPFHSSRPMRSPSISRTVSRTEPTRAPEPPTRREEKIDSQGSPLMRATTLQSSPGTAGAGRVLSPTINSAGVSAVEMRGPSNHRALPAQSVQAQSLKARGAGAEHEPALLPRLKQTAIEIPGSRPAFPQSAQSPTPVSPEGSRTARLTSLVAQMAAPAAWRSLGRDSRLGAAGPAMAAVQPPVALRSEAANQRGALPASSAPGPAVEVSIGRVEVRAVFPEPATRRAAPPRSRPTVSLDDYLSQRHRGKR